MHGRILVVEDSEEVREFLVLLLEAEGYSVTSCEDADEAFVAARRERPDLVLTDLMLGATSGLDLITRIRSNLAPPVPPIVACSGFVGFESEALERGAELFLPKPIDAATIQKAVTAVLGRRRIADEERREAAVRSRTLRDQVLVAARVAVARLDRRQELQLRAQTASQFVPRYFGFGAMFVALIEDKQLRVRSSSQPKLWSRGEVLELPLCRDIMETSSALLVPDLTALGASVLRPDGERLRFFAGLPLLSGSIGVGVFCFVDVEPRRVGSEDYSMLETLGRRASALLSGHDGEVGPLWTDGGFLSREGLNLLLSCELLRTERGSLSLGLLVFSGGAPSVPLLPRTAIAEIDNGRFAILVARDNDEELQHALLDFVPAIAQDFGGGGLVEIAGGAAALFDARVILAAAERLLENAALTRTVERIVFQREPHAFDLTRH